ncbi:MAG: carboxypeptidase regulatory-like domain-containing protein, partial [Candidatus Anammoxibacter sp.]
ETDASGNYKIGGLPAGTYKVEAETFGTSFIPEFFDNADFDSATPVKVTTGADTPNINFTLESGGSISGRVVDAASQPISGIFMSALRFDTGDWVSGGETDASGNYKIGGLPAGTYKVEAETFGTSFIPEFFDNADFNSATPVTVTTGADTPLINFVLTKGNFIKGKVTDRAANNPLPDIFVSAFDSVTDEWINGSETDENGDYAISVLPGTYIVKVETFGTNLAPVSKDGITVVSGLDTLNVDFSLTKANSIKGKVTDANGTPLPDMFVTVLRVTTEESVNFGITDLNGNYSIPVLPGTYVVEVDTFGTIFVQPSEKTVTVVEGADALGVDFILAQGNFIGGRVTDNAFNPIQGLFISAFEFDTGFWVGGDETDTNGEYEIPLLPGTYRVGVDAFGTNFAPVMFDNKGWDDANPVTVLKGEDTVNINFSLFPAGFITGNVRSKDGPLSGIFIDVFDFNTGFWISSGETGKNGDYAVPVRPGSYKVGTFASEQGFANKFFNDKANFEAADPVVVIGEGETVTGIDFVLRKGGSILGKITDGASGLSGIEVNAFEFNSDFWIRSGVTDTNGNYTISGLPAGQYRVWTFDPADVFPGEFYDGGDGVTSWDQAVPVTTLNEADTPNINFTLSEGGSISGKVTDGITGLNEISVEAFEFNTGIWVNSNDTDAFGNYSITLPDGQFRLRAFDRNRIFAAEYFDDVANWNEADPVSVSVGNSTLNVNFALSRGGFISGEVKNDINKLIKGVRVEVFDFNTGDWVDSGLTDGGGKYKVPVRAGKYRVGAFPFDPGFTPTFFNNLAGNVSNWDDASPVFVTDATNAENVNFRLSKGGMIVGSVKDNTGNGISEVSVQVFNFDTDSWINDDITDATGGFSVTVPAGRYRVWVLPLDTTSNISSEFYNDKRSWDLATIVDVVNEETTSLGDIVLSSGRSISGMVADDNNSPLVGANIDIFDYDTDSWINFGLTDKQGRYVIRGIQNGDYRVQASPPPGKDMVTEFFDNVSDWDSAKRVRIASNDLNGIDFMLSGGGSILGRVTDESNDNTICGIEVDAYDIDTDAWINSDITDSNGNYAILVPAGTYFVRVSASETDFVDEFFDNVIGRNNAKPVVVSIGKNANINFKLAKGGKINGIVKKTDGSEISGAEINVIDFDANVWVNNAITDSNGAFSVNVPTGSYRLQVRAPFGSDFVDEFFDDKTDFAQATSVNVTAPNVTTISDIILAEGRGFISGTVDAVIGSNTVTLEGIKINILGFDSDLQVASGFTDEDGNYTISVVPGGYLVFTSSKGTSRAFVDEFFDDTVTSASAKEVEVSASRTQIANFTLSIGSNIQGRVRSSVDLTPLAGVTVSAFQSDTSDWVGSDKTDGNGNYSIRIPNGTYKIWALPKNVTIGDDTFKPQFFSDTESFDNAKNIIINDADKTGVNFDLLKE